MTLSQRGLSIHINRSVSWIRKQGGAVCTSWVREGGEYVQCRQVWRREDYLSGRLAYYELVQALSEPSPKQN